MATGTTTLTLHMDDMQATDVFTALGDLLAEEIWDLTGAPIDEWTDHRLEALGRHAHALGVYATALALALLPGEVARQKAAAAARSTARAARAALDARLARLETHPDLSTVPPATRARIKAIRAEFADDPAALALLIDLAQARAEPAAPPAQAPTPAAEGAPA